MLGELEEALVLTRTCVERAPRLVPCLLWRAIALSEAGDEAAAKAVLQQVLEVDPGFTVAARTRLITYRRPEDLEAFGALMRESGFPG